MNLHHSLGIKGLPTVATALHSGAVYLLALSDQQLAPALLFANIPSTNSSPIVCVSRRFPTDMQATPGFNQRIHDHSLLLLSPVHNSQTMGKLLPCLEELDQQHRRLHPNHSMILLLDHAEHYLPLANQAETLQSLQACKRWASRHGHTLVLLLDNHPAKSTASQSTLSKLGADCSGLATAHSIGAGQYSWQLEHWLGAPSALAAEVFILEMDANDALFLPLDTQATSNAEQPATDSFSILATRASMSDNPAPTPHWQLFDDLTQLVEAAQSAVAATLLLDSSASKTLKSTVHQLRQHCGKRLKIVVREMGSRHLRQNEEQLLLGLGANIVLPAELRFSSVISVVNALQPAIFHGKSTVEQQQLDAASQPESDCGYLPAQRFVEVVNKSVQRSRAVDIGNTLIRLRPAAGTSPQELLKLAHFQRTGDLCSADRDYAYLFLFACRAHDVDTALSHLFRMPVGEVAQSETRSHDAASILLALTTMAEQAGFSRLPDLTLVLASSDEEEPQQMQPAPTAVAALPLRRVPLQRRHAAPGKAVHV